MAKMHPNARMSRCYSKVRHESLGLAEGEANVLKAMNGYPFAVYHCDLCNGFHVGHIKRPRYHGHRQDKRKVGSIIRNLSNWRDPDRNGEPLTKEETIERARAHHALRLARRQSKSGKPKCEVIVCGVGPHRCEGTAMREKTIDGHRVCAFHGIEHPEFAVFTDEEAIALHRSRKRVRSRLEIDQGASA